MSEEEPKPALRLESGNPVLIIMEAQKALRKARVGEERIAQFTNDALNSDDEHLIEVLMRYFDVIE